VIILQKGDKNCLALGTFQMFKIKRNFSNLLNSKDISGPSKVGIFGDLKRSKSSESSKSGVEATEKVAS
jgi:hypothetical protein